MRISKLASLLLAAVTVLSFTACGESGADGSSSSAASSASGGVYEAPTSQEIAEVAMNGNIYAEITMKNGNKIVLELYPDIAPITVANFVKLTKAGYYDGVIFHRVISGFMIQTGDPTGTGRGGPGYTIKGEFSANGVTNDLKHTRGVISMARTNAGYDTAGSQFFIMHADYPSLNGLYAAFGTVVEGMDEVDRIAAVSTGANDKPVTDQTIDTVRILDNYTKN